MDKTSVLFAGFGDLARRSLGELEGGTFQATALGRKLQQLPVGIGSLRADLTEPSSLQPLASADFDAVVITLTPAQRDEQGYRKIFIEGLANLLAALEQSPPRLILFASSTSVYHQHDGQWVDEASAVHPSGFSGQVLLEAEALLANFPTDTVAIRFGGLYGGDKPYMLEQLRNGGRYEPLPVAYSNRLHREDAAALLAYLLRSHLAGMPLPTVVNAVDDLPAPIYDVSEWLCRQMGLPAKGERVLSRRVGSKRVANRRLKELGYKLRYPDYKAGYGGELPAMGKAP